MGEPANTVGLFITGNDNDAIYEYGLTTYYNISVISYLAKSLIVASQTTSPRALHFSTNGEFCFVLASTGIYQYTLSTKWDISTATYTSTSTIPTAQVSGNARGMFLSDDGTVIYTFENAAKIYQYPLSTAWDITSVSANGDEYYNASSEESHFTDGHINAAGTTLYLSNGDGKLHQYTLSTAWDITTASYVSKTYDFGVYTDSVSINVDEAVLIHLDTAGALRLYEFGTAGDISTLSLSATISDPFADEDTTITGAYFRDPPVYNSYRQFFTKKHHQYNPFPLLGGV